MPWQGGPGSSSKPLGYGNDERRAIAALPLACVWLMAVGAALAVAFSDGGGVRPAIEGDMKADRVSHPGRTIPLIGDGATGAQRPRSASAGDGNGRCVRNPLPALGCNAWLGDLRYPNPGLPS